jgi:hypothetical protein
MVTPVILEQPDLRVQMETLEILVQLVHKATREILAQLVLKEIRATPG